SPSSPSTGGPTRKATYPIVAAKDTRAADCSASAASAPAAEIATGNPSEAPSPQSTTAPVAAPPWSRNTTPAMPAAPTSALVRSTAARPYRLTNRPPPNRPTVIETANTADTPDPQEAAKPLPDRITSRNPPLPVPRVIARP